MPSGIPGMLKFWVATLIQYLGYGFFGSFSAACANPAHNKSAVSRPVQSSVPALLNNAFHITVPPWIKLLRMIH
jgi:hypothetical protein